MYNVEEFIQYIPGKCFRPFTEKVVKLRSEATVEGDDAKGLTAKLFGNAGKSVVYENNYLPWSHDTMVLTNYFRLW